MSNTFKCYYCSLKLCIEVCGTTLLTHSLYFYTRTYGFIDFITILLLHAGVESKPLWLVRTVFKVKIYLSQIRLLMD